MYNRLSVQWVTACCDLLQPLPVFAFDMLSGQGDLLDIVNFIFEDQRPDSSTITKEEYQRLVNMEPKGVWVSFF